MSIRTYMCLDVRGAIANTQRSRSKRTGFLNDKGEPLNKLEAIDALMDELAKGREVIPMNNKCGMPCKQAASCKGFDYSSHGGCPGHVILPDEASQ